MLNALQQAAGGAVRISRNGGRARTSIQLANESSGPVSALDDDDRNIAALSRRVSDADS
jgi:hypothetical protein